MRGRRTAVVLTAVLTTGLLLGGSSAQADPTRTASAGVTAATAASAGDPASRWTGLSPCTEPTLTTYLCGKLTVRLDRSNKRSKTLDLPVLVAGNPQADRTMLMLTGGPGQPGPILAPRVLRAFEGITDDYRIVMLDQRGTGVNALNCPQL
jgi:pimeloyl-ACP methyl ester carboxylesterase